MDEVSIHTLYPVNGVHTVIRHLAGSAHVHSETFKDSRWFAFWDHAQRWDAQWHQQCLVHAAAFWMEGKNPWDLEPSAGTDSSESYSLRLSVWNVMCSAVVCLTVTFCQHC